MVVKNVIISHTLFYNQYNKRKVEEKTGGETGIRTPEPVAQLLPFQGSAIDHSAISPADW